MAKQVVGLPLQKKIVRRDVVRRLWRSGCGLISKDRVTGDNPEVRNLRELKDNLGRKSIAQIIVLFVSAHVIKWQNGHRLLPAARSRHAGTKEKVRSQEAGQHQGRAAPDDPHGSPT